MRERIMAGKLFTDMCEGMPAERVRLLGRFSAVLEEEHNP